MVLCAPGCLALGVSLRRAALFWSLCIRLVMVGVTFGSSGDSQEATVVLYRESVEMLLQMKPAISIGGSVVFVCAREVMAWLIFDSHLT